MALGVRHTYPHGTATGDGGDEMIICHCNVVSDRDIQAAVDHGASTPDDVTRICRAGGDCGGCRESIQDLLEARATPISLARAS